jgi:hypothetical protein
MMVYVVPADPYAHALWFGLAKRGIRDMPPKLGKILQNFSVGKHFDFMK